MSTNGALEGIRVLDLSRILAGPWASQMLADFGARIIKVERPDAGDDTRHWGPPFVKDAKKGQSPEAAYYHCTNRNKESIAVDIRVKEGQEIIKALIAQSDVLIENYKVGGLARYGLDYQSVKSINPELVYCSISGFGQTGPYAHKPGYDAMIQGEGGLMSVTGEPDGEPMKVGVALVDVMTGLYSCNAIQSALFARQNTGKGQYIDMSLFDVQVATLANQGMNYLVTGENPQRLGNGHPNVVPYQTFSTKDGNIILAIGNDQQFSRFCGLCNKDALATNPLFSSNKQRVTNRKKLIPIIARELLKQTTDWWVAELENSQVPCGPVNTLNDVFNHPQIKHRKLIRELPDREDNPIVSVASPINLSETPLQYKSASPALGQHTKEILVDDLGYSNEIIDRLYENKVIG